MFPTTDWGLFESVRGADAPTRKYALETLASRYWRPVFLFIRQHGFESTRSLLQSSLKRFLSNAARTNRAKRRMPSKGFVSIEELAEAPGPHVEPFHGETPEALFNRAWAVTLVTRILSQMVSDARETGKTVHLDIFKRRIVQPLLDGAEAPAMRELAERHGLDEKRRRMPSSPPDGPISACSGMKSGSTHDPKTRSRPKCGTSSARFSGLSEFVKPTTSVSWTIIRKRNGKKEREHR